MEDLESLLGSSEFAVVKAAVDALDPMLMVDDRVGPHVRALRVVMGNLAKLEFPEEEPDGEPEPDPAPEGGA